MISVLSTLLGLFYLVLGIGGALLLANRVPLMAVVGLICALIGLACIAPAVMALAGRSAYREWHEASRPRRPTERSSRSR